MILVTLSLKIVKIFFSQNYSGGETVSTWNYLNEQFKLNPGDIDKTSTKIA